MKLTQLGNSKLHNQYMFNLPASKEVCNRTCKGCYAHREQRYPSVLAARTRRLVASKKTNFVETIIKEISSINKPFTAYRIHASGEFYSQEYIDKWQAIATALPDFTFYAYTKRMKDFNFVPLMTLPNVVIIDSLMHGGLNYDKKENLSKSIFTCPAKGCGTTCKYCQTKTAQKHGVQFVKH